MINVKRGVNEYEYEIKRMKEVRYFNFKTGEGNAFGVKLQNVKGNYYIYFVMLERDSLEIGTIVKFEWLFV